MGSQTEVYQDGGSPAVKVLKSPNEAQWGSDIPADGITHKHTQTHTHIYSKIHNIYTLC